MKHSHFLWMCRLHNTSEIGSEVCLIVAENIGVARVGMGFVDEIGFKWRSRLNTECRMPNWECIMLAMNERVWWRRIWLIGMSSPDCCTIRDDLIKSQLSWDELSWAELSWTELNWAELSWTKLSWAYSSWSELIWVVSLHLLSIVLSTGLGWKRIGRQGDGIGGRVRWASRKE